MSYRKKANIEARMNHLFSNISTISDEEIKSEIAKYLCILSSSFIEVSCRDIIQKYIKDKASPDVGRYVNNSIQKFRNPNKEKIIQLFGAFKDNMHDFLKNDIDDELWDAASSIVTHRHNIAHGTDSQITFVQIKDYHKRACKLLKKIATEFQR